MMSPMLSLEDKEMHKTHLLSHSLIWCFRGEAPMSTWGDQPFIFPHSWSLCDGGLLFSPDLINDTFVFISCAVCFGVLFNDVGRNALILPS